jgi:hypothetical protein
MLCVVHKERDAWKYLEERRNSGLVMTLTQEFTVLSPSAFAASMKLEEQRVYGQRKHRWQSRNLRRFKANVRNGGERARRSGGKSGETTHLPAQAATRDQFRRPGSQTSIERCCRRSCRVMEDSRSEVSFGPFWPQVVMRILRPGERITQLPLQACHSGATCVPGHTSGAKSRP